MDYPSACYCPTCPACGETYTNHLGLNGTCEQLQEAKSILERIADGGGIDADTEKEIRRFLNGETKC